MKPTPTLMTSFVKVFSAFCALTVFTILSATPLSAGTVAGGVNWSMAFTPNTVGPGSTSTLTYTINNLDPVPVTDLAFTNTLPAGVTLANPVMATTDCNGAILTASDGGGSITMTDGTLGGGASCTVSVLVTSSVAATHTNIAGDLTSSWGNSGPSQADLTVVTTLPSFSMSFSPSSVSVGGRSTLTYTVDNSANASAIGNLDFTHTLPVGITVASPANIQTSFQSTVFPPEITAVEGTGVIVFDQDGSLFAPGFAAIEAGEVKTLTVDVIGENTSLNHTVTGDLLADFVSAGTASASLQVTGGDLIISKKFLEDPVAPDDTVTLEYTIFNFDRSETATDVSFTDDLSLTLSGLTFSSLISSDAGGSVAGVGTTALTLTGGTIAPGGSVTIRANLTVPAGAVEGSYPSASGVVTASVAGNPVSGNSASDTLFVSWVPVLTKSFTNDPVTPGGSVTIEYTITNPSSSEMTDIAFIEPLTDQLGYFPLSVTLPAPGFCNGSGTMTLISLDTENQGLSMTGGTLAAGADCTFTVTLNIPDSLASGIFPSESYPITATHEGVSKTGNVASDDLVVVAAPSLSIEFIDDPVAAGGTVTLEYTLTHADDAPGTATGITFTHDLSVALAGMTATGLPLTDICGSGSSMSGSVGDSLLTFSGGSLAPGESCSFQVVAQVPAAAVSGIYTSTTSGVGATVSGVATTSTAASDNLSVAGLEFSHEWIGDPAIPGSIVTLRYIIENTSATDDASITFFTHNLQAELAGLAATGPPTVNTVGGSLSGTTFLIYTGGSVAAGQTETIEVEVLVPGGTADGTYQSITSSLTATMGGSVTIPPSSTPLSVNQTRLQLTKTFTDDPVQPGGTVTLEYTLTNLDPDRAISGISFTDDLEAALTGLVATGLPLNDICGAGSSISGTSLLTLAGGNLAPGGSATFSVTLQVPANAPFGSRITSTTSEVTGDTNMLIVRGDPAFDDLLISALTFTQSFDGLTSAGGAPVLSYVITNHDTVNSYSGISFSHDLSAVIPGLVATGLPLDDICGVGSQLAGTSFLTLTNGELGPGASCQIDVTLTVPGTAGAGTYPSVTSNLFLAGVPAAPAATANLQVEAAPTFTKAFSPTSILLGNVSTLTFTVDNTASTLAANSLDFTDNLPAGVAVAAIPNVVSTCGGTVTAVAGSGTINLTGGSVAAGATGTVSVDVVGNAVGTHLNTTGDLTSTSGNSGTASASLAVTKLVDIVVSVSDSADPVVAGSGSDNLVYTVTVTNTGPSSATNVVVGNVLGALPPGVTLGTITPTGGTFSAGTFTIPSLAKDASATLTYNLTVASNAATATDAVQLTSTLSSVTEAQSDTGNDSDTELTNIERQVDLGLQIVESIDPVVAGSGDDNLTYTVTLTNNGPSDASGIEISNTPDLPAGVTAKSPTPSQGTYNDVSNVWAVGSVNQGDSVTLVYQLTAASNTVAGTDVIGLSSQIIQVNEVLVVADSLRPGVRGAVSPPPVSERTSVAREVDLAVTVADSVDPVIAGSGSDNLTYTVTVTNNGPSDASDVVVGNVLSALPTGVSLGTITPSQGTYLAGDWTVGGLAKDANATMTFELTVASNAAEGVDALSLTSSLSSVTESQPNTTNDSATEETSIERRVDLDLAISESIDPVVAGSATGNLTYILTLTNHGVSDASGIEIANAFTLPTGVSIQSVTASEGTYTSATRAWALPSLANGSSETLTIMLTAASHTAEGTDVIDLTSSVSAVAETDNSPGNDSAQEKTSVSREVDLQVAVTESIDPVVAGSGIGNLTYVVTVTNNGPSDASGVSLNNSTTLPSGVTMVSETPSAGSFTGTNWNLGSLAAGSNANLTVVVTAGASAAETVDSITNTSNALTATETLINTGDDAASESTSVVRRVDLAVSVTESIDPVIAGSGPNNLTYVVTVENMGPSNASGVSLSSVTNFPTGVSVVSETPSAGTYTGTTWNLGTLNSGTSATLTVVLTVDATAASAVDAISSTNSVTAVNETDTNGGNNNASEATSIERRVDLIVGVAESVETVVAGSGSGNLTYEVTVRNGGPSDASGVELEETFTLPDGVSIDSITPSQGSYSDPKWNVGALASGETATLTVVLTVASHTAEGVDVITCATSVSAAHESLINGGALDTASESTSVTREVDLVVSVAESLDPVIAGYSPGNLTHTVTVTNSGPSDASGISLDIAQTLPAGVTVDSVTPSAGSSYTGTSWTIPTLVNGASATLVVVMTVPESQAGGTDLIETSASLTVVNETETNAADNAASEATSVLSTQSVGVVTLTAQPELNLQSGLFTHQVTVTNNNPNDITSLRIYIHNLPADVQVWNASGVDTHNGVANVPYVLINQTIAANGGSKVVNVEYFRANRDGDFDPVYQLELEYAPEDDTPNPAGPTQDPLSVTQLPDNGGFMLEWLSVPSVEYVVQYSDDDMATWKTVASKVTAFANKTQWVDSGLPKTISHPSTVTSRFYRIVTLNDPR